MSKQQKTQAKGSLKQIGTEKKFASLLILIMSDFMVVLISFSLAYLARNEILPQFFKIYVNINLTPVRYFHKFFYLGGIWIAIFAYEKLYTKRFSFWKEFQVLVKSTSIASLIVMIMVFMAKEVEFSRSIIVLMWSISLAIFPLSRFIVKSFLVKANLWKKKLIILGVQKTSLLILKSIKNSKTMGYEVVSFLDDDPNKIGKSYLGVKVQGPISQLEDIINTYRSRDIMITTPSLPRKRLSELLYKCESLSDSMWLIPRSGDFITEGVEIEILGEVLALYIKKNLAKPWNILLKTAFDMCFSLILLILLLPLFLIISLSVKLDSKGPVIFIQKRLGRDKKLFDLYKFRSMYTNSEGRLHEFINNNLKEKQTWEKYKKLKNFDPRITQIGKVIRKYSLDELPQLFNVLLGKMSLVGPRPYLPEELEEKRSFLSLISKVKPGITGMWQTSGRSEVPFEQRITIDEYYIRNWSLWLDIIILLKTIKIWFSSTGAY